jgi:hypothetical protein
MANNTQINTGSGDIIRTIDRTTFKTDVAIIDRGGSAGEDLGPLYGDTASGNITGTTSVSIAKPFGFCTVGVQIAGTFVGTLIFEGSIDNSNYVAMSVVPMGGTGIPVAQATAPGIWQADSTGMATFRVRCTAYTSGTAVVTLISSVGDGGGRLTGALPPGNNLIGFSGQQPTYAATATRTITLASLAHNASATSDNVDNSVTRYSQVLAQLKVRSNATTASANGFVALYLARSLDAGTTWDGMADSLLLGTVPLNQAATSYTISAVIANPGPMYRLSVLNQSGGALDATAGNHSLKVTGVN